MMKNTSILLFAIICAIGCEQDQKQKPPPVLLVDVRDENGFIPQCHSHIVTGVYTPYGNKKLTYLKWNVSPVLCSGQSIHMYLVDSPWDIDYYKRGRKDGGFSLASVSLDQKPTDRAGNYFSPQQLKEICASLSKAKEWSRIATEQNLNVQNKELYSRGAREFIGSAAPRKGGEDSKDIIIGFTQEQGATNYSVSIQLDREYRSGALGIDHPYIILDEGGVEHFIKATEIILSAHSDVVATKEKADQEKADRQAQQKADAEKAEAYLK